MVWVGVCRPALWFQPTDSEQLGSHVLGPECSCRLQLCTSRPSQRLTEVVLGVGHILQQQAQHHILPRQRPAAMFIGRACNYLEAAFSTARKRLASRQAHAAPAGCHPTHSKLQQPHPNQAGASSGRRWNRLALDTACVARSRDSTTPQPARYLTAQLSAGRLAQLSSAGTGTNSCAAGCKPQERTGTMHSASAYRQRGWPHPAAPHRAHTCGSSSSSSSRVVLEWCRIRGRQVYRAGAPVA